MINSKRLIASRKILLILLIGSIWVQTMSCTHWLIETETRIQVENLTDVVISNLCIVSEDGKKIVLVPGSIDKKSKVYEIELVGEFDFMVRVGDDWKPLGRHKLKGGSVLVKINGRDGKYEMVIV